MFLVLLASLCSDDRVHTKSVFRHASNKPVIKDTQVTPLVPKTKLSDKAKERKKILIKEVILKDSYRQK